MYCQLKNSKGLKVVSVFLAINMLQQIIVPSVALALTGGPSQPEMESFEPISTNQMVDLFTGDFNYNLPLLTVPGPNGGYPINLAYHAGIGMEDQASWVGLGWNINPGSVKRQMRGLPDDFNGATVSKTFHIKDDVTWALDLGTHTEFLGVGLAKKNKNNNLDVYCQPDKGNTAKGTGEPLESGAPQSPSAFSESYNHFADMTKFVPSLNANLGVRFYHNSYRGVGLGLGLDVSGSMAMMGQSLGINAGINFNSQQGATATTTGWSPSLSVGHRELGLTADYSGSQTYQSKVGKISRQSNWGMSLLGVRTSHSNVVQRASQAYLPATSHNMNNTSHSLRYNYAQKGKLFRGIYAGLSRDVSTVSQATQDYSSYGYLAMGDQNGGSALLDYNKEKASVLSRDVQTLPLPNLTYDVFAVSGHGGGGTFRPHRSDIGILYPYQRNVDGESAGLTVEYTKDGGQYGGDLVSGKSDSYTRKWINTDGASTVGLSDTASPEDQIMSNAIQNSNAYAFESKTGLNTEFYFKNTSEVNLNNYPTIDENGDPNLIYTDDFLPVRVGKNKSILYPEIIPPADQRTRIERAPRMQQLQVIDRTQAIASGILGPEIYEECTFPRTEANPYQYDYGNYSDEVTMGYSSPDKLGKIRKMINTTASGYRYEYGLPVHTLNETSAMIGLGTQSIANIGDLRKPIPLSAQDVDVSDRKGDGREEFYSSTTMDNYANSFLLTAIFSPDYVDLTGDGPSDDDLGYYVQFNYTGDNDVNGGQNYKWRHPYTDGVYHPGYYSDKKDDRLSYEYGEKEIYFLNSIETKTHIAEFHLSERLDAHGVSTEFQTESSPLGKGLRKLEKISMYSKNDPDYINDNDPKPIKTVHFDYSYELCQNLPNHKNVEGGPADNATCIQDDRPGTGKLTLKKLWFSYQDNSKGSLSPYLFDYNHTDPAENPDYDQRQTDRWGNYKPETDVYNHMNPYVNQSESTNATRDIHASAWNLKKITFPSGSELEINYEQDRYTHVQNKQAMQMYEFVGYQYTSNDQLANWFSWDDQTLAPTYMKHNEGKVYFRFNKSLTDEVADEDEANALLSDALSGFGKDNDNPDNDMFFKIFMRLGNVQGQEKLDYIEGYTSIDTQATGVDYHNGEWLGYIKLESKQTENNKSIHPFIRESIRHIRDQRMDFSETAGYSDVSLNTLKNIYEEFKNNYEQLSDGYDKWVYDTHRPRPKFGTDKMPSYLRLYAPKTGKYGGGHRISSVILHDNWGDMVEGAASSTYGTKYSYEKVESDDATSKISSGIAAYEPILGGEEIPHRLPLRYHSNRYVETVDKNLYVETPIAESLFPAPIVGYSRVVTESIGHANQADKSKAAISVSEFYTAKDFPVRTDRTDVKQETYTENDADRWPFKTAESTQHVGLSQSYLVHLNDMHGKLKRQGTYRALTNIDHYNAQPVHAISYEYHTQKPYSEGITNRLKSEVKTMMPDGTIAMAELGKTYDVAIETEHNIVDAEDSSIELTYITGLQVPIPLLYDSKVDYSQGTVVSLKAISQNAILKKVITYKDGAELSLEHQVYDGQTGAVVMSKVNTAHEKPVYTYNRPAYLDYKGMGGSWQNEGLILLTATISSGIYNNFNDYPFIEGDELLLNSNQSAWVTAVNGDEVEIRDASNALVNSSGSLKIVRSGYRNLLGVSNASVAALYDVSTDISRIEKNLEKIFLGITNDVSTISIEKCDGQSYIVPLDLSNTTINIDNVEAGQIELIETGNLNDPMTYLGNYILDIGGKKGVIKNLSGDFLGACEGVLSAQAGRFASDWIYNYTDAGNPIIDDTPTNLDYSATINPYRYGQSGVYRAESALAYQTDRTQSGETTTYETNIAEDGTFNSFSYFNPYDDTDYDGEGWAITNTITKYDPYGFELENKNPLDQYSSALYGYDHSLATAVGVNSSYFELAFDGFEDYGVLGNIAETNHGHINFVANGNATVTIQEGGHTGDRSLLLDAQGNDISFTIDLTETEERYFKPETSKKYVLSYWYKDWAWNGVGTPTAEEGNQAPILLMYPEATSLDPDFGMNYYDNLIENEGDLVADRITVEGWTRYMGVFTIPANVTTFSFSVSKTSVVIDDLRLHPFEGGAATYVYDPNNLKLQAELDSENFATIYNYDDEGGLVQVKKETEKGIVTLQSTYSHTRMEPSENE